MNEPHKRHLEYSRRIFSMRQIRDCVQGSDAIKRSGELYLPMPSGMRIEGLASFGSGVETKSTNQLADDSLSRTDAPWSHSNHAYSAYVQRARFPDMTKSTMKGLLGISTSEEPEIKMPTGLDYLEDVATIDGGSIIDLFENSLSEVIQVGRAALILDVRDDNTFYIAEYSSETYINWEFAVVNGRRVQSYAEFEISVMKGEKEQKESLTFSLEPHEEHEGKLVCVTRRYIDGKLVDGSEIVMAIQGRALEFLPIVNINAETATNSPKIDTLPLLGISDCALDFYRHSADLNQNHFMACNQTLVFTGVDSDDAPKQVGSTVAICLTDPESDAKYISASTGALSEVRQYNQEVIQEAVNYGSNILGPTKRAAESAETLSLRQANSGATLSTIVKSVGAGINRILNMAVQARTGKPQNEEYFTASTEFAELNLSAPEITALLNSWMSGGISHLSFLENLQNAGRIGDRTADEELVQIDREGPVVVGGAVDNKDEPDDQDA